MPKPLTTLGIGIDRLPENIRKSKVLTGNDLGILGNIEDFPNPEEINTFIKSSTELQSLVEQEDTDKVHQKAKEFIEEKKVTEAWKILLAKEMKFENN